MDERQSRTPVTRERDAGAWQIGGGAEVAWIVEGTGIGVAITAAIPPVFAAYATVVVPDADDGRAAWDETLLAVLRSESPDQPWWLGYLDTGAADVVFPDAPMVILYTGWSYVLVEAGPDQAATWRSTERATPWHSALPELMFPADRSWLISTLWDDDWACVGGSASLVETLVGHPQLLVRAVVLGEDATPPGHEAR